MTNLKTWVPIMETAAGRRHLERADRVVGHVRRILEHFKTAKVPTLRVPFSPEDFEIRNAVQFLIEKIIDCETGTGYVQDGVLGFYWLNVTIKTIP